MNDAQRKELARNLVEEFMSDSKPHVRQYIDRASYRRAQNRWTYKVRAATKKMLNFCLQNPVS